MSENDRAAPPLNTGSASRPAEQGEPVAWAYEYRFVSGWAPAQSVREPKESQWVRNVRPLYAHPAPAASRPAVGREEIARALTPFVQHTTSTMLGDRLARKGFDAIDWRRKDEVAGAILALMADPRDDTRAGGADAQEGGWLPIAEKPDDPDVYVHLPDGEVAGLGWATDVDDRLVYLLWWQEVSPGRSDVTHFRKTIAGPPSPAPETRDDTRDGGTDNQGEQK